MKTVFSSAEISEYNSIKMLTLIFKRNEFTESIYNKLQQIKKEESVVTNLYIEMERVYINSYMPKIEYYGKNFVEIAYEEYNNLSNSSPDTEFIIKSKEQYDEYFNWLLDSIKYDVLKEEINNKKELYDATFFEENALIITKSIIRGSGSINLTINNLYVSNNKVYIVVRTDEPGIGTADIKFFSFTIKVKKSDVENVNEVITLE